MTPPSTSKAKNAFHHPQQQQQFANAQNAADSSRHHSKAHSSNSTTDGSSTTDLGDSQPLVEGSQIRIDGVRGKNHGYLVMRPLGKGSFGCVWQVRRLPTEEERKAPDFDPNTHRGQCFALKELYCKGQPA